MKNRKHLLATWLSVALALFWSIGLGFCPGDSDCCCRPSEALNEESSSSCCSEHGSSNETFQPTGERQSQKVCSCGKLPQSTVSVAKVVLDALAPSELEFSFERSSQALPEAPHSSARRLIWSPSKARAPPATGLS